VVPEGRDDLLSLTLDDLLDCGSRPDRIRDIDAEELTPFQHALLHIDGTVTRFIEAYQNEDTDTILLGQETSTLTKPNFYLQLPDGSDVSLRQVLIQGRSSGRIYVYAPSVLDHSSLSVEMLSILNSRDGSLGKMLEVCEVENRRQMMWSGREEIGQINGKAGSAGGRNARTCYLTRTYRIIANGSPLVVINEKFPLAQCNDEV